MLNRVEALANQDNMVNLSLQNPANGYVVANIDGLDPVPATLVSSTFANMDGEQFQASRRGKRNIVIQLELKPEYAQKSVRELRNRLYGIFMPKSRVRLRFFDDVLPSVDIYGTVETFDSPLFSAVPYATISLVCFDSDFVDPEPMIITETTVNTSREFVIDYPGTVETGIILRMQVDRNLSAFTIHHRPEDGTVRYLKFIEPLVSGDNLVINTNKGSKAATLQRNGVWRSILYGVSSDSIWTTLHTRKNNIRIFSTGEPIPFTLEYLNKYGGL